MNARNLSIVLISVAFASGHTQEVISSASGPSVLQLSLVIPSLGTEGPGMMQRPGGKVARFHVLLTNVSTAPLHVSRLPGTLTFELTDENGKTSIAHRAPITYDSGGPNPFDLGYLKPGEMHVFDIDCGDPSQWTGFPPSGSGRQFITVRATYAVRAFVKARQDGMWEGRIVSEPVRVLSVNPK